MIESMNKRYQFICLMTSITMGLSVLVVNGAPVLGTDNFDGGEASRSGWQSDGSDGADSIPLVGGVSGGYYKLFFDGTGDPGQQVGYIFNTDANHIGNYSNHVVSFSFMVMPVSDPAVELNFYFRSQSGARWSNDFKVPSNVWTTVSFDFYGDGWSTSSSGADFMTDIGYITEIGIDVNHLNANGSVFTYGLDNWTVGIPVPEPESMALAVVAIISLLLTFRHPILAIVRRRREYDN